MSEQPAVYTTNRDPGDETRPARGPELVEQLAAIEHERWSDWQRYLHEKCARQTDGALVIPPFLVARWERQMATPYAALSEPEKQADRDQVARYWHLVHDDDAAPDPPARMESAAIEAVARRLYREQQSRWTSRATEAMRGGLHVRGGTEAYVMAMLAARDAMLALGEALEPSCAGGNRAAAPVDAACCAASPSATGTEESR